MTITRRDFVKACGAGVLLGLTGSVQASESPSENTRDGRYDFNDSLITGYRNIIGQTALVGFSYKWEKNTERGFFIGICAGIPFKNKILTAYHTLFREPAPAQTGVNIDNCHYEDAEVSVNGRDAEIIHGDKENDLAVIDYVKEGSDIEEPLIGDSDEIEPGHIVSMVGVPIQNLGSVLKTLKKSYICSDTSSPTMLFASKAGPENSFLVWNYSSPGDSGGPVFAYRDGIPEVVGMNITNQENFCEAHKMNHIREILSDI